MNDLWNIVVLHLVQPPLLCCRWSWRPFWRVHPSESEESSGSTPFATLTDPWASTPPPPGSSESGSEGPRPVWGVRDRMRGGGRLRCLILTWYRGVTYPLLLLSSLLFLLLCVVFHPSIIKPDLKRDSLLQEWQISCHRHISVFRWTAGWKLSGLLILCCFSLKIWWVCFIVRQVYLSSDLTWSLCVLWSSLLWSLICFRAASTPCSRDRRCYWSDQLLISQHSVDLLWLIIGLIHEKKNPYRESSLFFMNMCSDFTIKLVLSQTELTSCQCLPAQVCLCAAPQALCFSPPQRFLVCFVAQPETAQNADILAAWFTVWLIRSRLWPSLSGGWYESNLSDDPAADNIYL